MSLYGNPTTGFFLLCVCLLVSIYTVVCQPIDNTESTTSLLSLNYRSPPDDVVMTTPTTEPQIQHISTVAVDVDQTDTAASFKRRLQRPWRPKNDPDLDILQDDDTKECDKEGLNDDLKCNETNMERCVSVLERVTRCSCLQGYSRANDGSHKCIAVRYYRGTMNIWLRYETELHDKTSSMFRSLEFDARNALHNAAHSSRLRPVMVDIRVIGFTESLNDRTTTIHFDLLLPRQYAPDPALVRQDLIDGMLHMRTPDDRSHGGMFILLNSSISFTQTDILVTADDIAAIKIIGVDSCSDRLLNHCDVTATCNMTSYGGFECICQQGFIDTSPNRIEASGEKCSLMCGTDGCQNDGQCVYDDNGVPYCKCSSWFLGPHCSVDAKVLLIIVVTSSAVLTLLVILACFCGAAKLRNNYVISSIDTGSNDSPTSASHVTGWKDTDTWQFYALVGRYKNTSGERPQLVPVHHDYGHSYFAYGPDIDLRTHRGQSSITTETSSSSISDGEQRM